MKSADLDRGYWEHPKVLRLEDMIATRHGDSWGLAAAAVPPRLWCWAITSAPDGRLRGLSERQIARVVRWPERRAADLLHALVECGLLDREQDGTLAIHGWEDGTGGALTRYSSETQRARAYRRWGRGDSGSAAPGGTPGNASGTGSGGASGNAAPMPRGMPQAMPGDAARHAAGNAVPMPSALPGPALPGPALPCTDQDPTAPQTVGHTARARVNRAVAGVPTRPESPGGRGGLSPSLPESDRSEARKAVAVAARLDAEPPADGETAAAGGDAMPTPPSSAVAWPPASDTPRWLAVVEAVQTLGALREVARAASAAHVAPEVWQAYGRRSRDLDEPTAAGVAP